METTYVTRIRALTEWRELQQFWGKYLTDSVSDNWPPGKILEHVVLRAFELDGAAVTWPYSVKLDGQEIEQIDGAVHVAGISCLVECKDTTDAVNVEPLAKLRNQLLRRSSSVVGILVSRNGFTSPAQTLAQFLAPQTILLWYGAELMKLFEQPTNRMVWALQTKWRKCVEQGVSDFRVDVLPELL